MKASTLIKHLQAYIDEYGDDIDIQVMGELESEELDMVTYYDPETKQPHIVCIMTRDEAALECEEEE